MSGAMMPVSGAPVMLLRDSKRAARVISYGTSETHMRLAGIDNETDVTVGKEDSQTAVTAQGMQDITGIAQLQKHLETMEPSVSGRLAILADFHAMSMVEIVSDHQRALRRR